jgi:hypothetical protein
VIGTGAHGALPVMKEVKREAERSNVKLMILPTSQAIEALQENPKDTNARPQISISPGLNGIVKW